ncbi:Sister chromatid cohesion protein pds5 [Neolecta irregularis DAH-3]|uniref:Sister chromatid cohesion protein pds5 n=1 Tax=Neolecta irregularis (strain DAH-3) TaxID=1198029 RepID=A0A1U7LKU7_NEOID|nr:Sister chromatid cohesion protein pds5 [Neolecta irregularis DAH-3]|eukprot:OLL23274.1 Sister chromatid cohesion protein pds5 [Neolecta irregularis DAH-3]
MHSLSFTDPLSSLPAKPIPLAVLLKRLKALHLELVQLPQDSVARNSLAAVTADLPANALLHHKDRGVRAYTACCLADILRLYAPDAPFTENQLALIFDCFLKQLKGLESHESPYYPQYLYLLDSLATVKTIILMTDLSNADPLILETFRLFFDIANPHTPKNVQHLMTEILQQLVDEAQAISPQITDVILSQFMRNTSPLNPSFHPAYTMAKHICSRAAERLQRNICQYFTDVLYESASPEQDDLQQLDTAHSLIIQLWKAAPPVLMNVIPLLENELVVVNPHLRTLATDTLGAMIADPATNLVHLYPQTWSAWQGRKKDKIPQVRIKWIERAKDILVHRPEVVQDLTNGIASLLADSDIKVRATACNILGSFDYEIVMERIPHQLLQILAERCKDKSAPVRENAMVSVAKLWDKAYTDILHELNAAVEKLAWLPSAIFNAIYVNDPEINAFIEYVLHERFLPSRLDEKARVERILVLMKHFGSKSTKAFISGGVSQVAETQTHLNKVAHFLANTMPDPVKTEKDLLKFAHAHDRRCYKLLRETMNAQSDYQSVRKAQKEALKRIEQASSSMAETWAPIVNRIALTTYNKSFIPILVAFTRDAKSGLDQPAHAFLKEISECQPAIYKQSITDITDLLCSEAKSEDSTTSSALTETIQSLARFARAFPQDLPRDQSLVDALLIFARTGTAPQAKHAITILTQTDEKTQLSRDLLSDIMADLTFENKYFVSQMSVLRQLVFCMPKVMQQHVDTITEYIIREILLHNKISGTSDDAEWVDDENLNKETQAKILAVQFLVNRLRARHQDFPAKELGLPVFRVLGSIIANNGEISKDKDTPSFCQSRLRLVAGGCLLKLACIAEYEDMIYPQDFNKDSCYQVRQGIVSKLIKALALDRIPPRYYTLLFLMAHEPQTELRDEVKLSLKSKAAQLRSRKLHHLELGLPRLVHLLAHHPDFSDSAQDLLEFSRYFTFYLETVANVENVSLLFHLAQRTKQVCDAIEPDNSKNIYALSDMAQVLIKSKADQMGWIMQTYPQKVKLDKDIFKTLADSTTAAEIARKSFLPPDILSSLPGTMRLESRTNKKRKISDEGSGNPIKKTRTTPRKCKTPRKQKIKEVVLPLSERRRSARVAPNVSYIQGGSDSEENEDEEISDVSE